MPSPFPGMNPWLEQSGVWHDFHERLIPAIADQITLSLPEDYFTRIDERIYIHESEENGSALVGRPDIVVMRDPPPQKAVTGGQTAVLEAPQRGKLPAMELERENFLEIIDRRDQAVVTAIELLSPTNKKSGPDREAYLAKRNQILASPTHFIEIDLRRSWGRMPGAHLLNCAYAILVSRHQERPEVGLWPIQLREPLPNIPVPLKAGDPDGMLDLKTALDRVYDSARYARSIYRSEPEPPLSQDDATWAQAILAAKV